MKGRNDCVKFPVVKLGAECWAQSDPSSPGSDSFQHSRMLLNQSADWSRGEINVMPGLIEFFWTPDIIIHDLVRSVEAMMALYSILLQEIIVFPS